jgi:hypothetical protein
MATNKEFGPEVIIAKTKYTLLSRHQNAGQNRDRNTSNKSFENVAQFKYLGTTVTNTALVQEEIMRTNSGNNCYNSVYNLMSSYLLSKNVRIKLYETIILPVFLY